MHNPENESISDFFKRAYWNFRQRNLLQKAVWILTLGFLIYIFFAKDSQYVSLIALPIGIVALMLDKLFASKDKTLIPYPGAKPKNPQFNVVANSQKFNVYLLPFMVILEGVLYWLFRNSLSQNGIYILIIPIVIMICISMVYNISKRNDPNYYGYYLFHLSKTSFIIIGIGVLVIVMVFIYSQCISSIGGTFTIKCVQQIFNGTLQ